MIGSFENVIFALSSHETTEALGAMAKATEWITARLIPDPRKIVLEDAWSSENELSPQGGRELRSTQSYVQR